MTRQELVDHVTAFVARKYSGDWKKAFEAEDVDGDGRISCDELCDIFQKSGIGGPLVRWAAAKEAIRAVDADGDGHVSWDEFQKLAHVA